MTQRDNTRASERIDGLETMRVQMDRAEADRLRIRKLAAAAGAVALAVVAVTAVMLGRAIASPEPPTAVAEAAPTPIAEAPAPEPEPETAPEPEPAPETAPAPEPAPAPAPKPAAEKPSVQRLSLAIGAAGYEPSVLTAKAGAPISITVAQGDGCAAGFLMPELGVSLDNSTAPATAELGTLEPGEYRYTCGMDMVSGVLSVR